MVPLRFVSPTRYASRRWCGDIALLCALGLLFVACGGNEYAPPPPPAVTVAQPVVQDVTRYAEFTGTTRAVESVEVRARVKGFLDSMEFEPGQTVEEGQLLFVIDPEPFQVALDAAEAELASNKAERDLAQTEYERSRTMYKRGATSELELIRNRAKRDKAVAAVAHSESTVHSAQLDLDYAHVKAPVSGRVGRHLVDIGNLVGSDGATHLTDLVQYDPLHVYFYVSEGDVLALQRRAREERQEQGLDYDSRERATIEVRKADEEGYPHVGEIDFTALEIDPATGTFEVRGVIPNGVDLDFAIIPGTFVQVRVPVGEQKNALLIPERALGADQGGRYLLIVNSDDVVEQHYVKLGSQMGDQRVILDGIRADDRVIINGLQRARPGAPVTPKMDGDAGRPAPPEGGAAPAETG